MPLRNYLFSVICLLTWIGAGCAGSSHPTTIVCGMCEEPDRFVRLQARPIPSSSEIQKSFSHPLRLSSENWEPILASIRVQPSLSFLRRGDEHPAFTEEEIDYLSMTLSRAFTQASPEQWVIFGLSKPVLSSGSEMTTGAWYVEGTKLHLLLPNFHAPVRMENVREVLNRDPLFEVLEATRYEFIPNDFSVKGEAQTSWHSILKEETPHLVIEYERLLAARSHFHNVERSDKDNKDGRPMQTEANDHSPSSLEDRLAR